MTQVAILKTIDFTLETSSVKAESNVAKSKPMQMRNFLEIIQSGAQ